MKTEGSVGDETKNDEEDDSDEEEDPTVSSVLLEMKCPILWV